LFATIQLNSYDTGMTLVHKTGEVTTENSGFC